MGFLSNNLSVVKDALDRAAGRKKEGNLADSSRDTREVVGKLAKDADLLFFCQPQSALETLLEIGASLGAHPVPQHVEQLRKVEAIGATTKLDEANCATISSCCGEIPRMSVRSTTAPIKFTSARTAAYFDFASNFVRSSPRYPMRPRPRALSPAEMQSTDCVS